MKASYLQRAYAKLIRNPSVRAYVKLQGGKLSPQDVITITGSPRSGTTWLSSMFSAPRGVTVINEPLSLRKQGIKELGFSWRTFILPGEERYDIKKYFDMLFSGRIANGYNTKDTPFIEIFGTKVWSVKFIRANRLLPWIVENFQLRRKPLLVIRHPCGVVYSQMKHPLFSPLKRVGAYDQELIEKHFPQFKPLLKVRTEEEIRALTWALDNFVPLHYWSPEKWMLLSYEELVLDSRRVLERVYSEWGQELPPEALSRARKRSREAKEWSQFDDKGVKKLGVWREYLSKRQIHAILDIAHQVGLEFSEDIEPDYGKLYSRH